MASPVHKPPAPVARGVTLDPCFWGLVLEGALNDLLASGFVDADWFSDWSERRPNGNVVRRRELCIQGRDISTVRPARGRCAVYIYLLDGEPDPRFDPTAWHGFLAARTTHNADFQRFMVRFTAPRMPKGRNRTALLLEIDELYRSDRGA